jgi:uncharacterized repeat protein (TIGR01451 family)
LRTCAASHTVDLGDLDTGFFYNQACVDDGAGGAAPACDDVTTPGSKNPELSITKDATESGFDAVGDVIHYTITAWNSGNVTLHNVDVTDSQVSDLDCTPATPVADLAPGDSIVCTASHTVTQGDLDAGHFYNQACVDDGQGNAAEACDDVDTKGDQNPALDITKTAEEQGYSEIGDMIHYTIRATNSGNVTLHDVLVTDPNVSDLLCIPANPVTDLQPGDSILCTASHTIDQSDLDAGSVYNQACVDDGEGPADSTCADVTVEGEQNPALDILKQVAEVEFTDVGQVLHYTITATNIGNVTLHDVNVSDAQVTDLACTPDVPVEDLAPGEQITCTASHTTTKADLDAGFYHNQACVDDNDGAAESGAAEVCSEVTTPGQQVQDLPTEPNTATAIRGGEGRPGDGAWLLIVILAVALGAFVMVTPARSRKRR